MLYVDPRWYTAAIHCPSGDSVGAENVPVPLVTGAALGSGPSKSTVHKFVCSSPRVVRSHRPSAERSAAPLVGRPAASTRGTAAPDAGTSKARRSEVELQSRNA